MSSEIKKNLLNRSTGSKGITSVLSFEISILGRNVCFCFGPCVLFHSSPSKPGCQRLNILAHKHSGPQPWRQANKLEELRLYSTLPNLQRLVLFWNSTTYRALLNPGTSRGVVFEDRAKSPAQKGFQMDARWAGLSFGNINKSQTYTVADDPTVYDSTFVMVKIE